MERLSEERLQWQSKLLLRMCIPLAVFEALISGIGIPLITGDFQQPKWQLVGHALVVLGVSLAFAALAAGTRAATVPAALCGGLLCFLLITNSDKASLGRSTFKDLGHSELPSLILLFALTFAATRWRRGRKQEMGVAEPRKGRQASQIVANLGVACLLPMLAISCYIIVSFVVGLVTQHASSQPPEWIQNASLLCLLSLAALAEATADTVSSEIGQAVGGRTWMLTTLTPIEVGVDGGVSLAGTAAGLASAALVVGAGAMTMGLNFVQSAIAFAGAVIGLFIDSLLGATVEQRGWMNNDVVNFLSTLVAALVAWIFVAV